MSQKIIVGLGNKGSEYIGTRHNVGFDVLNRLHRDIWLTAEDYEFGTLRKNHLVVKPSIGMNNSGTIVWYLQDVFKVHISDIVVIYDDMDFPVGQMRIKIGGGHGQHNGVKSIIKESGARFTRIRVGIGKPKGKGIDHVLGKFDKDERKLAEISIKRAVGAANYIIEKDVQSAMSIFNRRIKSD